MNRFVTAVLTLFLLAGCAATTDPAPLAEEKGNRTVFTGTVVFLSLEGGFFGIVGDDGSRYDPVNLPAALQKDGLKIRVVGRLLEKAVGFHMWGRKIEIIEAKPLQANPPAP